MQQANNNSTVRSRKQAAKRAAALAATGMVAESYIFYNGDMEPAQELLEDLFSSGYIKEGFFTDAELSFLAASQPPEMDAFQFQWGYEGYAALLWAMGLLEKLPLPKHPHESERTLPYFVQSDDFSDFYRKGKLRSEQELIDAVTLRESPTDGIDADACWEQWRALYWLTHPEIEWDTIR